MTDADAKRESAEGIVRHLTHFMSGATAGYLGSVSEKDRSVKLDYDELAATTLLHARRRPSSTGCGSAVAAAQ